MLPPAGVRHGLVPSSLHSRSEDRGDARVGCRFCESPSRGNHRSASEAAYRGRIDDRYAAPGKLRAEPTARDLQAAIEAVLAGQKPASPQTEAVGCPLPKAAPASAQ